MAPRDFHQCFRTWAAAACSEWKWREPDEAYFDRAYERLPQGLRTLIARGVASGLIIENGRQFTLRGLAPTKGPYAWFSRHTENEEPNPNWEYFVQVAEFVRLSEVAARSGHTITFEDQLIGRQPVGAGPRQRCTAEGQVPCRSPADVLLRRRDRHPA